MFHHNNDFELLKIRKRNIFSYFELSSNEFLLRMARSQTFNNRRELSNTDQRVAFQRPLSEDRITDQLRNPQIAYREAMESIASDSWEQKCSGLNLLQLLLAEYPDTITQNLHQVVLVLIAEVNFDYFSFLFFMIVSFRFEIFVHKLHVLLYRQWLICSNIFNVIWTLN